MFDVDEIEFHKYMVVLATMAYFTLTEEIIGIYVDCLNDIPYGELKLGVLSFIQHRHSKDRFPSPSEIRTACRPELSNKSAADDVANRMLGAIVRHGSIWVDGFITQGKTFFLAYVNKANQTHSNFQDAFIAECGEVAYQVMDRMGGYQTLCDEANRVNRSTLRAQLRDLALSVMEQGRKGKLSRPAMLSSKGKVLELASKTVKALPEGDK